MKFGPVPLDQARGAILAHSLMAGGQRLRKGLVLTADHLDQLRAEGIAHIIVARPDTADIAEDPAAERIARHLVGRSANLTLTAPVTGRVNVTAAAPGVVQLDHARIDAINAIDPGITVATLDRYARVAPGALVATVKIIPYAVPGQAVEAVTKELATPALSLATVRIKHADLILTAADNLTDKALAKGRDVVAARLAALGIRLGETVTVPHDTDAVAQAVRKSNAPLLLILGATATSDPADVCPAAVNAAGGRLIRFGMPVDPGNLLFLSEQAGRPVIGLPGCARSPALNGADWVLERIACGIPVTSADIAAMGVGGLLKEIPQRPHPRRMGEAEAGRVEIILLAAGSSSRMRGRDKLLEPVDGEPLLRRMARVALASSAAAVRVVLPPGGEARAAALDGLDVTQVTATAAAEGMAASLRAGLAEVAEGTEAGIVMLADMPDVTSQMLDRLIAAFDPAEGHEICRSVSASGVPGHPVLFGRRFFEALLDLSGDVGARAVVAQSPEFVHDVKTPGEAALTDLDTPEHWARYLDTATAE